MNMINVIAALVCGYSTMSAVGHRRYGMALIGFVITVANMWVAFK